MSRITQKVHRPKPGKPKPRRQRPIDERITDAVYRQATFHKRRRQGFVAIAAVLAVVIAWTMRRGASTKATAKGASLAAITQLSSKAPIPKVAAQQKAMTPRATQAIPVAAPTQVLKSVAPKTSPKPSSLQVSEARLEGDALDDNVYRQGTRLWLHTRVKGGNRGDAIQHVWLRNGRVVQTIPLEIGNGHWRTRSYKTLGTPGDWSVEARNAKGTVLYRQTFRCDEGEAISRVIEG